MSSSASLATRGKRIGYCIAVAALAAAGLAGCGSSSDKASGSGGGSHLVNVTVATPGPSSAFGFLWVAKDQGIFAKYGLNVKIETVSNAAQIPGLVKGSFQFIPQAGTSERAALQGQPVVNVLSALTNATSALVVRPGINSLSDLKGKTIATASAISTPTLLAKAYLQKNGLGDSVKLLSLQNEQAQETAFTSGQADGLFLNLDAAVEAQGKVKGSKMLATPEDLGLPAGAQAGLATSQSFLKAHPDVVKDMIGAALEATKYSIAHPDETAAIYAKEFGATTDEAKEIYSKIKPYIVLRGAPEDAELSANAASDSSAMNKTITLDDVKKAWNTTLAEQVFKQLNCPDVCAKS
jgi:NitT/TauT family transport system substrate-binding protein